MNWSNTSLEQIEGEDQRSWDYFHAHKEKIGGGNLLAIIKTALLNQCTRRLSQAGIVWPSYRKFFPLLGSIYYKKYGTYSGSGSLILLISVRLRFHPIPTSTTTFQKEIMIISFCVVQLLSTATFFKYFKSHKKYNEWCVVLVFCRPQRFLRVFKMAFDDQKFANCKGKAQRERDENVEHSSTFLWCKN